MKKIILILLCIATASGFAQPPKINVKPLLDTASKHISKATSTVYTDSKEVIATLYGDSKEVIGKGIIRLDTLLTEGYKQISKGASHTFEVLKTQQLVNSLYYLFYYIVGVILITTFLNNLNKAIKDSNDGIILKTVIFGVLAIFISTWNASNFNVMLTGFINPEYGVYLDILKYIGK